MNQNAELLKEIIQVATDGADFYEAAQREIEYSDLAQVFIRMAQAKRELIEALGARLQALGQEPRGSGTLLGALRRTYADVRASLSSDDVEIYVGQLEDAEDRLLDHVRDAIRKTSDPQVRLLLEEHMPRVRACHEEMRTLKRQLAAA